MAYLEKNVQQRELTKSVSLALHDPLALLKLKQTGECTFELPEHLYDLDYAGQANRRLTAVSLSIPCVTGPHTTISCTLTLLKNSCRIKSTPAVPYERDYQNDDPRFRDNLAAIQSFCTSTGQNDFGLHDFKFEGPCLNPFEYAGAISTWRVEMIKDPDLRQFDYESITDLVAHVRYRAKDGGPALKDAISTAMSSPK